MPTLTPLPAYRLCFQPCSLLGATGGSCLIREKPKPGSPLLGSPFSVATYPGQGMSHHVGRYKATPSLPPAPTCTCRRPPHPLREHPLPCPSPYAAPKTLSPTPSLGGRLWDSCLRFAIARAGILVANRKSSTVYPFCTFSCFHLHLVCTVRHHQGTRHISSYSSVGFD